MKKILLPLALFISTLSADIIGSLGLSYSKGENSGNYMTGFGQFNALAGIALRFEYTKNIDEHKSFSKENISRYGFFAVYPITILPYIDISPKAGFVKTDGDWTVLEGLKKFTSSKSKFSFGLDIDYYINDQFSAFIGYTDYGKKLDVKDVKAKDLDRSNYMIGIKLHI